MPSIEVVPAREATVGSSTVRRALPQRPRRTIGAWCFVDHFGPSEPEAADGLSVGPHPHCGLSTVTWLIRGSAVHTDSLGSEQPIRPGQLNLMTAGHGISHAEQTPTGERGDLHGVQFWVAQPEATRHGPAAFEHHAELPTVGVGDWRATVLLGSFGGERSPARADTPLVGVEFVAATERAATGTVELDPAFEHGIVVIEGQLELEGTSVGVGQLAYVPVGTAGVTLRADGAARWLVLGGEPFEAPVQMWWNFVGRTRDEMTTAVADWNEGSDRFGSTHSELARIAAPPTPWSD